MMHAPSHLVRTKTIQRAARRLAATLAGLLITASLAAAQDDGSRGAGFRPGAVAVQGAKLVIAPGTVVEQGNLVIRDGRIVAAGADVSIPVDARVIDGAGLVAYPGLIDAGNDSLIDDSKRDSTEDGRTPDFRSDALAATRTDHRRGLTPEFEARRALRLSDDPLDARRKVGFTAVHATPLRAVAGGQGCVVSLAGTPPRESLLLDTAYCVFRLEPPNDERRSSTTTSYPVTIMGATAHLRQALLDAGHHQELQRLFAAGHPDAVRPAQDPVLDVLAEVLEGKLRPLFLADSRDEIHRALDFAEEFELTPALLGGRDALECIDRLAAGKVPLLLRVDLPEKPKVETEEPSEELVAEIKDPLRYQEEVVRLWEERASTAAKLIEAGVPVAISTQGLDKPESLLPKVRILVEHGLSEDAALAALTSAPAEILGVNHLLGTLEPGRLGHVVLMTGPLTDERSQVRHVLIEGRTFEYNKEAEPVGPDSPAPDAIDVAGRWVVEIKSGEMEMTNGELFLAVNDGKLSGTFSSEQGDGRIDSGKLTGTGIEFVVSIGAGGRDIRLRFTGEYQVGAEEESPDRLSGELKSPFGAPTAWTAERIKEEDAAADNPVELAIEEDATADEGEPANVAVQFPTELDTDRTQRTAETGGNVLVRGATVVTGTGQTLPETDVLIRDGKIAEIGTGLTADEGITVIDVAGWFVMPGLIDTHSHIMIEGGVNESSQSIVPEVRVRDVVRSNDVSEYRALAGGVTTARLLHGSANVIGGQDAVVKLKYGRPAHEHILFDAPQGVKFALGENVKARTDRFPNTRMGVEATLKRAFFEALDYRRRWQEYELALKQAEADAPAPVPPRRDLRLECLADIIDREAFIHCHCYRADEILMLLRTAEELGIRVQSLQHVLEGYKIAPEILAHGASCSTFADWWAYKVEAYDATPFNTTLLNRAGVNTVVKSDNAELIRHMNLEAAKSLRYGNMPFEDAVRLVTLNSARELGLDDRIGSIEVGKDGDLAIFNGHPFSPFSRCEWTIIDGEVWFQRAAQPTAMSAEAQARSAQPPPLQLASSSVRDRKLELPQAVHAVYALTGAKIVPVDGPMIDSGVVLIAEGRIAEVGADVAVPEDAVVIDLTGLEVYPGLIDAGTTLGISEIRQVAATQDARESGRFQPDLRAGTAVNVDSELIPVARTGGITTAFIRPGGGTISGQYSLLQTAGWTSEEMVLNYRAGLSVDWPGDEERVDELREFLETARLYDRIQSQPEEERPPVVEDPRYEAMRPYLSGERRIFIEADSRQAIVEAILFSEKEELKIVITGGTDAWKVAGELKAREIPVIVGPTMRSPVSGWDPFDATYANPGRLYEAGVEFCIRSDDASNSRNAPFEAAIAVAYGLPEEEALKAITLNAARILGIDERVGSITPGKTANLVITDGSPLQPTTQIKGVFVAGRPFPPESRQTRFYERYLQRLDNSPATD